MDVQQLEYETLLSEYSNRDGAIALLKKYRPYLEMIPSLRRPSESVIAIPLPVAKIRHQNGLSNFASSEVTLLPCDLAILMCDAEWKIKMGVEILVFIHGPGEDFSNLLLRWRQTQILLHNEYEWIMPPGDQHMFSERADQIYPLFVVFEATPERIKRGLTGASLPFLMETPKNRENQEIMAAQF
ncbi:MAG: hypothetical protein DSM107014_10685 [Gomphosphaeria aponina SAG 52.96 = DSM 107014]|uniref:Type IV pilin PilA n=1 Tax=Gomphosphaeria aponina SAG 52.96 = DSM 107014 TaxID=1521640 RepID=A0A941JML5_9CHRO|nr:hypothetical protein [Gomphosphaeria aponina SAG 52.96 = DSM 107014]